MKISVCVPVYNCAAFLGQALDSILPQAGEQVEVVVYDGGSTDGTPDLMDKYISAWPNLRYHRGKSRGGIDADLTTCIELAQGEYCWLFSGDDVMHSGAISRALEWVKFEDDVYVCKHTICDKQMDVFGEYQIFSPDIPMRMELSEIRVRHEWFQHAVTTEAFFSFMSGLMIRKSKWQSGQLPGAFAGSCWGHVARLFGLVKSGLRVCYVAEAWLDRRGENDSFADKGFINRCRIGIEGYHRLGEWYFGHESVEAFHIRRVIRNEFGLLVFLDGKLKCKENPTQESQELLDSLVKKTYSDFSLQNILKLSLYYIVPVGIYGLLRHINMQFRLSKRLLGGAR